MFLTGTSVQIVDSCSEESPSRGLTDSDRNIVRHVEQTSHKMFASLRIGL